MSDRQDFKTLLLNVGISGQYVSPEHLERLAATVVDRALHEEFVAAVLVTCEAEWQDGARPATGEFSMRVGGWRLDLAKGGIRSGLLTTVVAGALVQQGMTEIAIAVATAVIPSVLDIERVELGAGDRRLLLELRLHPDVAARALTEDELYAKLPEETREVVNRYDFADFVQRLREAGYASPDARTNLAGPDDGRPWISWR